jgi:hypothetical protein
VRRLGTARRLHIYIYMICYKNILFDIFFNVCYALYITYLYCQLLYCPRLRSCLALLRVALLLVERLRVRSDLPV